jgi:hypothetical protein
MLSRFKINTNDPIRIKNFFFAAWTMNFQIMMKERLTKCIFKVNHIFRISIFLLKFSALQEHPLQGAQKYPDKIVGMSRHASAAQKHVGARMIF